MPPQYAPVQSRPAVSASHAARVRDAGADPVRGDDLRRRRASCSSSSPCSRGWRCRSSAARRPCGTRPWCSIRRSCSSATRTRTSPRAGSGARRQAGLHLAVLLLPLVALPIALPAGWVPPGDTSPVPWLLALLAVAVGLPFFAVSATSPVLQAWFAATEHRAARDPYVLYAASNVGSLLALLAYPADRRAAAPADGAEPPLGLGLRRLRRARRRLRHRSLAGADRPRGRSRRRRPTASPAGRAWVRTRQSGPSPSRGARAGSPSPPCRRA